MSTAANMEMVMTDADIERLAKDAGCFPPGTSRNYWAVTNLRRLVELVQAEERKRCAVIAETSHPHDWAFIGAAIRNGVA